MLAGKMQQQQQSPYDDPYAIPFASTSAERRQLDFSVGAATPPGDEKSQLGGTVEGEEKRKKKRPRQVLSCEWILRCIGERKGVR